VADEVGVQAYSADSADVSALGRVRGEIGAVDVLIHAAGILRARRFRRQSLEDFEATVKANLSTAYAAATAFVPAMSAGARVVVISSTAGVDAGLYLSAYAASKSAVRVLAATMRAELEADGIGVRIVLPGTVDSEMMAVTETERAALMPEDVVSAVAWLVNLPPRVRVDELIIRPVERSPFVHRIHPSRDAQSAAAGARL
jgi:NADP-dependent 3-hydroxy acid dehydrogenase YdfG